MCSIMITLILVNIYIKTSNGKLILLPFIVCSIVLLMKNIFLLINKDKYSKIFNKIYAIGFLMFWFGFLMFWCYTSVISKQYSMLLFSIPFWIAGIYFFRKRILDRNIKFTNNKFNVNFGIVISCILVAVVLLLGILMLFWGIKDTYKLNKQTKNYHITNGYYHDYEIYDSDEDGTTYKLLYSYKVDDREYIISTDYGTNYIPDINSIRKVKYNPDNPSEAILVGTNNKNVLIYGGAFFVFGSLTFVIFGLTVLGVFDKVKIDVIGIYIGFVFVIIGIGLVLIQTGTTMSLLETIKNMKFGIFIPIMFVVIGLYQIVKCLFVKKV